jgi:hypothetical protein
MSSRLSSLDRLLPRSPERRWRQESNASEYDYRERSKARLIGDQSTSTRHLDVEGTSSVVIVVQDRGVGKPSAAAS